MAEVYVSPTGSDVTGDGTVGRPWQTIAFAKSSAATLGLVGPRMLDDCNINLTNAALHRMTAKQSHGPSLSGQNGKKLRYVGTGRTGTTRILASQRVTGWTVDAGSVWKATIGTAPIYTLYEDGRRLMEARFPKYVHQTAFPMARGAWVRAEGVVGSSTVIQYPVGSLDPATWGSLAQLKVTINSGGTFLWFTDVVPVQSINTGTRQIALTRPTRYEIHSGAGGSQFFCHGTRALLTQAGEFFHDTSSGILYVWPWKGGDPNTYGIEMPLMTTAFEFLGISAIDRTHDIELNNIAICNTDFTNDYSYAWTTEGQSGEGHVYGAYDRIVTRPVHRQGLITRINCNNITLRNVELAGAGYNAIYEYGYNQGHIDENVWGHNCGMGGLYRDGLYPDEGDVSRGNYARNVLFNNCGELTAHGAGISQINAGHNVFELWEVQQCAGQGYAVHSYSFGGGGYPTPDPSMLYAEGNIGRRGKIRNVGQARGDLGACGVGGIGSRLAGPTKSNLLDGLDIDGVLPEPAEYDVGGNGLFPDNEAKGQVWKNAKIVNTSGATTRENSADSIGTQVYENVQGKTTFDPALVPACGVTREFPF